MKESKFEIPNPSVIMRSKRPYLYSDSETTDAYQLSSSELSHHLDTLTDRNQHKDFENFARKICEREICPNLRPQTGPEGGGDGKVDSESYPVDTKISERWFVAEAREGKEKWAFAVSAKKQWSPKVRSDVEGIVETKRGYDKIIFVTNRPTRAKDRLRIEDELLQKYGVPVTILDREWIIDKVFTNNHKDLVFEQLNAGQHNLDALKLGPNDFKNQQALDEIEDSIKNMGADSSDFTQAVGGTFDAADLSRKLERPRFETEGRFIRAIDFAQKYGANYQELRAVYGHAWTRFWWFDDVQGMQELYERVEEIAFQIGHAEHVRKVCNLFQLITSQVLHKKSTAKELKLNERAERLRQVLKKMSEDNTRPNNALYAETLLQFHDLNMKVLGGSFDAFDETWNELSNIVDRAEGLGEYPAGLLDSMIEALSPFAPDSKAFDQLIEKVAEFMAERDKELSAGETYLRHGERKLDAELPIEAIKYLGRAAVNFMKEESRVQQHQTLYYLAVAYRGAGLLWAARSASLGAIGQVSVISEVNSEIPAEIIPSLTLFAMIALQTGNISDFLSAIQYLNVSKDVLPLDDGSKKRLEEKFIEYDQLFSCLIVGLATNEIQRLEQLPDVLEPLGLFTARMTLLYRLGYGDILETDGTLPDDIPKDELASMMSMMAAQPATKELPSKVILLDDHFGELSTSVLGAKICVSAPSNLQGYLLAEAHISFLEAFISTFLSQRAFAHTEKLSVRIEIDDQKETPTIEFNPEGYVLTVTIPKSWDATQIDNHSSFMSHLIEFGAHVLGNVFILSDHDKTLNEVIGIERAFERATMFSRAGVTRNRFFGGFAGQLSDWNQFVERSYPRLDSAPAITAKTLPSEPPGEPSAESVFDELKRHGDLSVSSIINQHLWDKARWNGMSYGYSPNGEPPMVGLMFKDADSAKAIFREWRKRFGKIDEEDEIRISVVKGIDSDNPYHYRGCVGRDLEAVDTDDLRQFISVMRLNTMTVHNHQNLEMFLKNLNAHGFYFLAPAVVGASGQYEFIPELAIAKSKFHVREAWQIGMHDVDVMGVSLTDKVVIPEDQDNAPVIELLEWKRKAGSN
jgi:hypothetical protein